MRKTVCMFLCALSALLFFRMSVFADNVQSSMYQPVPQIIDNGNGTVSYVQYYVVDRTGYYLYELSFTCPVNSDPTIRLDHNQMVQINLKCSNSDVSNVSVNVYDVVTGYLLESYYGTNLINTSSAYLITGFSCSVMFRVGYFPKQYRDDSDFVKGYPIVNISTYGNDSGANATPFIDWAVPSINQTYYHSVLPKPDADEYNRFVVITAENEAHLLWLNYHFQFIYGVQSQTSATFEEYDIKQSDYYSPTVRYSDDGFSFRLQMDPILFLYLQNLNFSGSVCCNYTLTDYNLITGEFISMTSGNIEDLQPDNQYNLFSGYIDFDAVGIDLFGLNYEDTRTDGHLHRAAVLYSTDPDFERWKQSVLMWLENIYNVISATETAEDVTIDNNIEAASELTEVIDALQPTYENGSKINTADVVSERFSDAGAYIGDMREGGTAINHLIDTFFFSSPFFYVPVIVALALGLLITILGKNKSD